MIQRLVYLLLLYAVCSTEAAHILGIFPAPSISHQLTFQAIMKALAARGHQITVISPDPLKAFLVFNSFIYEISTTITLQIMLSLSSTLQFRNNFLHPNTVYKIY